jgi:RNA polymerase sigma-70 factor (ECF subfamily)
MSRPTDHREWVLAALEDYEARLVRYARRLIGEEGQARDVVQFVFLRLCDQSPEEIGEWLGQWLFTVCRNRALDVVRGARREKVNGQRVGLAVSAGAAVGGQSPPHDPVATAEQAELHALLRVLVECLPASQREAIDLWADGFSYIEISKIIGKQEGHVRVLVHRGLKALREHPQVRGLMAEDEENERRILPVDEATRRGGRKPQMEHR